MTICRKINTRVFLVEEANDCSIIKGRGRVILFVDWNILGSRLATLLESRWNRRRGQPDIQLGNKKYLITPPQNSASSPVGLQERQTCLSVPPPPHFDQLGFFTEALFPSSEVQFCLKLDLNCNIFCIHNVLLFT